MIALRTHGISKGFGGVLAVQNVTLNVQIGTVHSVIGPNGAGKTTLINLISGIYRPDAGRIELFGTDVTGHAPERLVGHGLSRTFQNIKIFNEMTVLENVLVGAHQRLNTSILAGMLNLPSIWKADKEVTEEAEALLETVGIADVRHADASQISYGHLKRLEIARALASHPKLLLLDEPAAGLNASETANIASVVKGLSENGLGILLVEHDMSLVMAISDRISVLDQGKTLMEGTPDEVRADPRVIKAYLGEPA
ncbi:ABC transporter ATP-binding protein [Mesorhizobium sp. CAU 1741]|uniref:ABC transporter ATP-binding protein n=1 Tax=Mesorhizobium sp. CAU 1741 TaxID=3140366 RepID=UPI00325C0216